MGFKYLALTLGVGVAAGAVAVMMLPKDCTVRQLANKAAVKVDDAMQNMADKIGDKMAEN